MEHPVEREKPLKLTRFLQQTLTEGEFVLRKGEFHWLYTFRACLKAGVWVALGFGAAYVYTTFFAQKVAAADRNVPVLMLPIFGILIGGAVFIATMLQKWTTEIWLTNRRFLYKYGVFSIVTYKLNMHEINYCNITQSLVGNMLNYGRIYMYTHTLDDKNIYLPEIARPHDFTKEIENVKRMMY